MISTGAPHPLEKWAHRLSVSAMATSELSSTMFACFDGASDAALRVCGLHYGGAPVCQLSCVFFVSACILASVSLPKAPSTSRMWALLFYTRNYHYCYHYQEDSCNKHHEYAVGKSVIP